MRAGKYAKMRGKYGRHHAMANHPAAKELATLRKELAETKAELSLVRAEFAHEMEVSVHVSRCEIKKLDEAQEELTRCKSDCRDIFEHLDQDRESKAMKRVNEMSARLAALLGSEGA
jgi:hypothetical protein